jgi:hypothetical protein
MSRPNFITSRAALPGPEALIAKALSRPGALRIGCRPTYSVRDLDPARTACEWGMSPSEVRRLAGTMHFLRTTRRPCYYAVNAD